jgi:hypothetical protein
MAMTDRQRRGWSSPPAKERPFFQEKSFLDFSVWFFDGSIIAQNIVDSRYSLEI